jgi:hypothetical protein
LEAKNSSCDKFNIISPSSYNWVSFNWLAWDSGFDHSFFPRLPGVSIGHLGSIFAKSVTDERILSFTCTVSACVSLLSMAPIVVATTGTLCSMITHLLKDPNRVVLLIVLLELWSILFLEFLCSEAHFFVFSHIIVLIR